MDPTDSTERDGATGSTDPDDSGGSTDPDAAGSADLGGSPESTEQSPAVPTAAEQACFEAGIKFGSLYHQFAGTPVSPASAATLARGIEDAIENQPHCEQVTVEMDTEALAADIAEGSASYTELTGRFIEVKIGIEREGCAVIAEMTMENGYPLMSITSIDRTEP